MKSWLKIEVRPNDCIKIYWKIKIFAVISLDNLESRLKPVGKIR